MRKNVLQLVGSFNQGGSERQAVQLIKLLKADDTHNIFVATLSREGSLLKELEIAGIYDIPEFRLNSFFDANFLKQLYLFRKLLKTHKIDVIQTHDFYSNVFGMIGARMAKTPIKLAAKRETLGMRTRKQIKMEDRIFDIADRVVVNSRAVSDYLVGRGLTEEKISVIYNGLDHTRLMPQELDRMKIVELLELPSGNESRFVTHVANLRHDVKNQEMVLRSAVSIVKNFPEVHFVFAGEGERKAMLESQALTEGISANVHFIGSCSNVPELLSISEVCLLTSFAEGFSNSILEYMFAGKPVIATDVGGAREAILPGVTGFVIPSDCDSSLTESLSNLLSDPDLGKKFGKAGKDEIEKRFSLDKQLKETLALY